LDSELIALLLGDKELKEKLPKKIYKNKIINEASSQGIAAE